MQDVRTNELVGLYEAIYDNDLKIQSHKDTCKEIAAETKGLIQEFAKEKEIAEKNIRAAYKYYKEQVIEGEDGNDDYFTLCALVDMINDEPLTRVLNNFSKNVDKDKTDDDEPDETAEK